MNYNTVLYNILKGDVNIQTSALAGKIYPIVVPNLGEAAMPSVSYTKKVMPYMDKAMTKMDEVEFHLFILDDHPDDMDELCQLVRDAIDGHGIIKTPSYTVAQINFMEQDHERYDHELGKYYVKIIYQMQVKKV